MARVSQERHLEDFLYRALQHHLCRSRASPFRWSSEGSRMTRRNRVAEPLWEHVLKASGAKDSLGPAPKIVSDAVGLLLEQ